jgi:hypothetical protein
MQYVSMPVLAAAIGTLALAGAPAKAHVFARNVAAPTEVENVACRVIRERIERPFAPVEFRERRVCEPELLVNNEDCVVRRERIVRPNGSVVYRQVRRCD